MLLEEIKHLISSTLSKDLSDEINGQLENSTMLHVRMLIRTYITKCPVQSSREKTIALGCLNDHLDNGNIHKIDLTTALEYIKKYYKG